jgi:hypothetical protein
MLVAVDIDFLTLLRDFNLPEFGLIPNKSPDDDFGEGRLH